MASGFHFTPGVDGRLEKYFADAGGGTAITMSAGTVNSGGKRLVAVLVHLDSPSTMNITVELDSGEGAGYDTIVETIALSADADAVYLPEGGVPLSEKDMVRVSVPSGTAHRYVQAYLKSN